MLVKAQQDVASPTRKGQPRERVAESCELEPCSDLTVPGRGARDRRSCVDLRGLVDERVFDASTHRNEFPLGYQIEFLAVLEFIDGRPLTLRRCAVKIASPLDRCGPDYDINITLIVNHAEPLGSVYQVRARSEIRGDSATAIG